MEINANYSFQVDSDIVKSVFKEKDNFLIEYSKDVPKKYCIVYFASNDLYYPNTEMAFQKQLLDKNRFEWYKTRIKYGYKHIFIRDIQKQWYLGGINSDINNPSKLFDFLKAETEGYSIVMVGSSAGGFAATIYGQLLKAERIYSFNGQFEIRSILNSSSENIDPLIFRYKDISDFIKWYDTRNFISNPSSIYYFQSLDSKWDISQFEQIKDVPIKRIGFKTSNHGIPFLSANLPFVLNLNDSELIKLTKKNQSPLIFSIKAIGLFQTIMALSVILNYGIKKIYRNTVLKAKN